MGKKPSKINVDQKELEDEIRKARHLMVNKRLPTIEIDIYSNGASMAQMGSQDLTNSALKGKSKEHIDSERR